VVGLSMHVDQDIADAMRGAGAAAYVTKGGPPEDLIEAIRTHARD
jgi:DNA-binding NarL/FixJ family response regulator